MLYRKSIQSSTKVEKKKNQQTKITEFSKENLVDNNLSDDESCSLHTNRSCSIHTNMTAQSKRNVRNKSTQIKARPCKCNDKKQVKSTATQTFLTKDNIVAQLITSVCFVSVGTQTADASPLNADDFHQLHPSDNTINMLSNAPIDAIHSSNKPDCNKIRSDHDDCDSDDCDSDSDNSIVNDTCFKPEFEY